MADYTFDDIQLDEGFEANAPISAEEWAEIVYARLPRLRNVPGVSGVHNAFARQNLINNLARAIPPELRKREIAESGDLRALLYRLAIDPMREEDAKEMTVGGQEFSEQERRYANALMAEMNTTMLGEYESAFMTMLTDAEQTNPDSINFMAEQARQANDVWRVGKMARVVTDGASSVGRDETGALTTVGAAPAEAGVVVDDYDEGLAAILGNSTVEGEKVRPAKFINRHEMQRLLQSGQIELRDDLTPSFTGLYAGDPSRPTRFQDRVLYTDEQTDRTITPDEVPGGPWTTNSRGLDADEGKDWYSLTEILRMPSSMTREEAMAAHEKLKAAGIYDRIGGGEPAVPGDVTDPQFKRAWKELAGMSLETGKSMMSVLDERRDAYEATLAAKMGLALTDPARLRASANSYAYQSLGRHLNDEEQAAMVEFIHELERRNAKVQAGLDPDMESDMDLEEGVIADIDARMDEYIRDQNPVEAEAHDTANAYEMFSGMLRGPGRGI